MQFDRPQGARHTPWLLGLLCLLLSTACAAAPVRWTITDARLEGGASVAGFFIYDTDTEQFTEWSVVVVGGANASFPAATYSNANSTAYTELLQGYPRKTLIFSLNENTRDLRLTPTSVLPNAGGTVAIDTNTPDGGSGSIECFNCFPSRRVISGNLVGTTPAASFTIVPGISGNWYDPAQDGHGFQFEVLPGGVVTAFWFTFDNAGNQAWITGAGSILGNQVVISAIRVLNGRFPPNFNSATLQRPAWGTLVFTFTDCTHARVDWNTTEAQFTASGSMLLSRLTSIGGTTCP